MLIEISASTEGHLRWINPAHVKVAIASVDERPPGTFEAYVELRMIEQDYALGVELGGHPTPEAAHQAARDFIAGLRV